MNFKPNSLFQNTNKPGVPKKAAKSNLEDKQVDNPITKGLFQMFNSFKKIDLESTFEHPYDIECKLKSLEFLNFFNELRQDSLLSIFIDWFSEFCKKQISEKKGKGIHFEEELVKASTNFIENDFKSKIPKLFLTGIDVVDQEDGGEENIFKDLLNLGKNMRKIVNLKIDEKATETIPDLNKIFTLPNSAKKVSILPSLLLLFYRNTNPEVEKRVLRLITRLFNQREELFHNFLSLEMIFERKEASLFNFLQGKVQHLRVLVEKSELWMSRLAINPDNPKESDKKTIETIIVLLKDLNLFFFKDIEIQDERLNFTVPILEKIKKNLIKKGDLVILKERQNLMKFLKGHLPVINLIKDCLHQFRAIIFNNKTEFEFKQMIVEMFSFCFIILTHFCFNNQKNQLILYDYLYVFQEHLYYDLKQIPLICAIFAENKLLLEKVDYSLLSFFFQLIENEGRQSIFLDFFLLIQKYKNEFLQENQSLVLKSLLPQKDFTEREHKILYSLPNASNKIDFYFDELFVPKRLDFLLHLQENDFQDTYRDEPFHYQNKLLEVLLMTTKGSSNMNLALNKLKKYFDIGYLVGLLIEDDAFLQENQSSKINKDQGFTLLKPTVLRFLIEVHFVKKNLGEILENRAFLRKLLFFEARRIKSVESEITNKNYIVYFFQNILGFLFSLFESFLRSLSLNMNSLNLEELENYSSLYELKDALIRKEAILLAKSKRIQCC